ncbi:hypothetical protein NDU88_003142 [Pleurodeles waltl]|uniref:Uncharacterized protein n=1 Tax=Pleurodeles waltl TaxID=8319 RepID=A0AAV7RHM8_PLEWA|nr:hypothetical protein NDU88_003142 [Pleurodeles waltl]
MRRARARVLNGRRRPLRDAVSEGQKKGRAFPYNNRALNTQVSHAMDAGAQQSQVSQTLETRHFGTHGGMDFSEAAAAVGLWGRSFTCRRCRGIWPKRQSGVI